MIRMTCPFCSTRLTMSDEYEGKEVDCPACKKTFIAVPGDSADLENTGKQKTIPRSVLEGKYTPPPMIPKTISGDDNSPCTNGASSRVVVPWFIIGGVICFFCFYADDGFVLGCVIASILSLVWALWLLICVRTIAINSARH